MSSSPIKLTNQELTFKFDKSSFLRCDIYIMNEHAHLANDSAVRSSVVIESVCSALPNTIGPMDGVPDKFEESYKDKVHENEVVSRAVSDALTDSLSTPFSPRSASGIRMKERHDALNRLVKGKLNQTLILENLIQIAKNFKRTDLPRRDLDQIIVHGPDHHLVSLGHCAFLIVEERNNAPSVYHPKSLWIPCLTSQMKGQYRTVLAPLQSKRTQPDSEIQIRAERGEVGFYSCCFRDERLGVHLRDLEIKLSGIK